MPKQYAVWLIVISMSSWNAIARPRRFVPPRASFVNPTPTRLNITSGGMIVSPQVSAPQVATVRARRGTAYLSNLMLNPNGGFVSGRGRDNAFHDLRIDPESGAVQVRGRDGVFAPLAGRRTEGDLRDFLLFNRMDGHPLVNRFLSRRGRFAGRRGGRRRGPALSGFGSHDGGVPDITLPDPAGGFRPMAEPGPVSVPVAGRPLDSDVSRTRRDPARPAGNMPTRFSMFTAVTENVTESGGTRRVQAIGGGCGSVPVSSEPTGAMTTDNKPECELAFYTAAHCFPTDADSPEGGSAQNPRFQYLIFGETQRRPLRVDRANLQVHFGPGYRGRDRRTTGPDGQEKVERVTSPDDFAIVTFKAACTYLNPNEIARFAGNSQQNTDGPVVGVGGDEALAAQSQDGQIVAGKVSGMSREGDQWQVQLEQAGAIDFGDSGGPIFNANGDLVGSISRKVAAKDEDPAFAYSFDPKGVPWARSILVSRGHKLTRETPVTPEGDEPPAPDRRTGPPSPSPAPPPRPPSVGPDGFDDTPQAKGTRYHFGSPPYPIPLDENGNPIPQRPEPGDEPPAPMPGPGGTRRDEPPAPMPRGDVPPGPRPDPRRGPPMPGDPGYRPMPMPPDPRRGMPPPGMPMPRPDDEEPGTGGE